jgi:gliding motility-associated lipoprotein GldH
LIRIASIGIIFLLTLSACDRGVLVSEKWEWKNQQWHAGDKKSFVMEATDTTTVYQMDIQISHEESYGYQNVYIRTLTTYPSGKDVTSVTSLELINQDGSWAGDKGEGGRKVDIPLQQRFTFPEVGKYTWTVEPYMRMDTIQGINSLKVTCRKVKE